MSHGKYISKYIGKNVSKNLIDKYSQKLLDHDKQSASDAQKEQLKKQFCSSAGDFTGTKIAGRITKIAKPSQKTIWRQLKMCIVKK